MAVSFAPVAVNVVDYNYSDKPEFVTSFEHGIISTKLCVAYYVPLY